MVTLVTETNSTPGGRTQIISLDTAGIILTAVEQVARGHIFDKEGRRRKIQKSKKPKEYELSYTNTNARKLLYIETWNI